jgi:hypothetical protein
MKKLILAAMAVVTLCACQGEREYLSYRGLPMNMPFKAFQDSMMKRGFQVDTTATATGSLALFNPAAEYTVTVTYHKDSIDAIQENYAYSTNDSTAALFQPTRDSLQQILGGQPFMPKRGDDHKVCRFETKKGCVSVILENTNTPTFNVLYETATVTK